MKFKSIAGLALLTLAAAVSHHTQAQTFPTRPVRIVVPQTPGGASDALARIVGQKLSEKWGQPVVIENRAGAGGNIGMDLVAKSPGDGSKISFRIKRQFLVDADVDGVRADVRHQQCVAIAGRLRHHVHADVATRAGTV